MPTVYTLSIVVVLFAVLIPVGRRLYPHGSGFDYPAWVCALPIPLLMLIGAIATGFGLVATWMSGQVLFSAGAFDWVPLTGILAGVLITVHGISLFGLVMMKKKDESHH